MKKVKVISQVPLLNKQFIRRVRATKKKELEMKSATISNKKPLLSWEENLAAINKTIADIKKMYGV